MYKPLLFAPNPIYVFPIDKLHVTKAYQTNKNAEQVKV